MVRVTSRVFILPLLLALLGLGAVSRAAPPPPCPASPQGRAVSIRAEALTLDPDNPRRTSFGELRYLGGLILRGSDPALGGLSGLAMEPGGGLKAISDQGWWLSARLRREPAGRPLGLDQARLGPLLGLDGLPLKGKSRSDAEGLAVWQGGYLVSFERRHRLWFYPGPLGLAGRPRALSLPAWLSASPPNGGVEAVGVLADGRLLLLAEGRRGASRAAGALGDGRVWSQIGYPLANGFRPTALAGLPGGGCLVLERAYSPALGARARVCLVPADQLKPGATPRPRLLAELAPPLVTDNFEGLAITPAPDGGLLIYLLSDDNFSSLQRTLLLCFQWRP